MADLGFSKRGFCSAEECRLKLSHAEVESKKGVINFYNPIFLSHHATFLSSNKATAIDYLLLHLDVTVLSESLGLTALFYYLNLTTQFST